MPAYTFKQGRYYLAGIDKPMIVPTSTIVEAVNDMGFRVISYGEAEQAGCGRSPNFIPPGKCGDDWDWMGLAVRTGPTQTIDIPDRVWWIYEYQPMTPAVPPGQGPPGQPPPQQPPAQPAWVNPQPATPSGTSLPSKAEVAQGASKHSTLVAIVVGSIGGLVVARWLRR